jgi:hypothetical protein
MKYAYLTGIIDLKFKEKLKNPIEIKDGIFLSNNALHTAGLIKTDKLITIGSLEAKILTTDYPVIYRVADEKNPLDAHTEVVNLLRETQAFLMAVWLHRDNSANCELGFALCQENEHTHSNALALHYSKSDGTKGQTVLNPEELRSVCDIQASFMQGAREQDRAKHTYFRGTNNRLNRGALFLRQARSSEDLGQKVANYCSFFETLLSTSANELSHQLAERCAFFLDDTPAERFSRFKQIKKAYGVRSKIVHGDTLNTSAIESLPDISRSCDDAARKAFRLIINHAEIAEIFKQGKNESLDAFMQNLIFGIIKNSRELSPQQSSTDERIDT